MKEYTFEIKITEGNDEFWDEISRSGDSGIDDIRRSIIDAIANGDRTMGLPFTVKIKKFVDYSDEAK